MKGLLRNLLGGSGDLLSSYFYRVISTITPIRVPFRVLISLLTTYLLSPPTLQVVYKNPWHPELCKLLPAALATLWSKPR